MPTRDDIKDKMIYDIYCQAKDMKGGYLKAQALMQKTLGLKIPWTTIASAVQRYKKRQNLGVDKSTK